MTTRDLNATIPPGTISRSVDDIARVLETLLAENVAIVARLDGNGLKFESRLCLVDPAREYLLVAMSANEVANAALLARAHTSFLAEPGDWHVEFDAAEPQATTHEGAAAIRMRFPKVIASHSRRADARAHVQTQPALRCIVDAGGVMSFDGQIVDVSSGGVGFLLYAADITLAPGTVLYGCRIEHPGDDPVTVDLEVRYSRPVVLADGSHAQRSGCRFLDAPDHVQELIRLFVKKPV